MCAWKSKLAGWLRLAVLVSLAIALSLLAAGCQVSGYGDVFSLSVPTATFRPSATLMPVAVTITPVWAATPSAPPQLIPAKILIVSTGLPEGKLNLRYGPGLEYDVILVLEEGWRLVDLDLSRDGWSHVRYGTQEGWVFSVYVKER